MTARVPLSVLDLSPVSSGADAGTALRHSIDLAQRAEHLGYARYWLAEHHLHPGLAGSAPLAFANVLAGATSRIRIGTAATLIGHLSPLQIAEAAGLVATLFEGRMDLGLGRTGPAASPGRAVPATSAVPSLPEPRLPEPALPEPGGPMASGRVVDGVLLPTPVRVSPSRGRFGLLAEMLYRPGDESFEEAVTNILSYLDGTAVDPGEWSGSTSGRPVGVGGIRPLPVLPAEGSGAEVWIHGSSAGESARLAGSLGLPFGANYHTTPSTVIDAVAEYRKHFVPGRIAAPHVIVSADVLVGPTDEAARVAGLGFAQWVHSVRTGEGTIAYPSPSEAIAAPLDAADLGLVQDRLDTRFVGSPATVVARLEALQRATAADELVVTTIAHAHSDRLLSYELLAAAWRG